MDKGTNLPPLREKLEHARCYRSLDPYPANHNPFSPSLPELDTCGGSDLVDIHLDIDYPFHDIPHAPRSIPHD